MEELLRFMALARVDHRIGPAHVSLYLALVCLKQEIGVEGVFEVGRGEGMERSRILGKERYYRCLKELAEMGYVGYEPQFYPGKRSRVWIGRM
jgi:hypothetical protein